MKILTIIRKSGTTTIEMPDDANVLEVLKENEIKTFESATVKEICYKSNKPCEYGCKGLCKESY